MPGYHTISVALVTFIFLTLPYYWWGEKELITQLRSQSALAVSRLAALGRPGVTEGDVKTAMAMKIMDLLGGGGMFLEFFAMDFDENFILPGDFSVLPWLRVEGVAATRCIWCVIVHKS